MCLSERKTRDLKTTEQLEQEKIEQEKKAEAKFRLKAKKKYDKNKISKGNQAATETSTTGVKKSYVQ